MSLKSPIPSKHHASLQIRSSKQLHKSRRFLPFLPIAVVSPLSAQICDQENALLSPLSISSIHKGSHPNMIIGSCLEAKGEKEN
jgi:hypothetical protein